MNGTDQYNFVEWEDTTTNPVRIISLTSNTTITATYDLATENYTLTVNSLPIVGVNFTVGSTTYVTNQSVSLLEGPHTVTMPSTWMNGTDQYNFVEWEDNSTNPQRAILLTSNKTITATYELALTPVASFMFSPVEPIVAETVTFNASASADSDGTIVSYAWDFGDGDSGSGAIVEHVYTAAGTYTVTLTVTDNDGLTHTITKTITAKETPPSGIPSELYLIAAGLIAIIIIAIVVYYLKIMRQKPA
jgi:PKD repeat protein